MVKSGDLFVFYGLLKQGAAGAPAHIPLGTAGRYGDSCWFCGRMVDLGGYPGVVAGDGVCQGVRWRILDTGIVPAMDAFEDVTDDAESSLYIRSRTHLLNRAHQPTGEQAWIYMYNQPVDSFREVVDGNWPLTAGKARK